METQEYQNTKPTVSQHIIFGLGSGLFLGLVTGGIISQIFKPNLENPATAGMWLGGFVVLFFLIGAIFPQIFTRYFTGLLRGRGTLVTDDQLKQNVSWGWAVYFPLLALICFVLIFTRYSNSVPFVFAIGFGILIIFAKVKK